MILVALIGGLTGLHFSTGISKGPEHLLHVGLRVAYFLPLVLGAQWFGLRGGVGVAMACSALLLFHAETSWAAHPRENTNQMAMALLFPVVGIVGGLLVDRERTERKARLDQERKLERRVVVQCIASLADALAAKDTETRSHSEQVAMLGAWVAAEMRLADELCELVRLAGLAHDIGKIGLRDDILFKPGPVDDTEGEQIRRHPEIAAAILRPIAGADRVAEIVLCHHEHLDGSGYPRGLSGDAIPLEARIVTATDVYSAMTQDRPYRSAISSDLALRRLSELSNAGKLDSGVVEALEKVLKRQQDASALQAPEGSYHRWAS